MRKIACLTLDTEEDYLDPTGRIRLFDDELLLQRYVAILAGRGVKLTAFLVTSMLPRYGEAYRRLCEQIPVEFAIHSHAHDMRDPSSPADIEQAVRLFRGFTGSDPIGYRAPGGQIRHPGLKALMDLGFRYDSSIYPSLRPGSPWGYNNLHLPLTPFLVRSGARSILEIPFASLSTIRLIFSLSYVKMLGWGAYRLLLRFFPLPDQASVLSHPYDHYFHLVQGQLTAPEKPLLMRNARSAFDLLERMLDYLIEAGYQFEFMSGLCDSLDVTALPAFPLDRVIRPGLPPLVTSG